MEKEKYYITTPIYYASGDLTVGHCFCTILADACARFMRLCNKDVFFLTGSDDHGLKILRNAEKVGLTPKQFVDKTVAHFKDIWSKLHISYDKFIQTTDKEHVDCVNYVINKLIANDDIYLGEYEGLYCVPCETFFTEGQLIDGKCPDCLRPVEKAKEEAYFLKMSKYQNFLTDLFQNNKDFIVPENRKNEIFNNFILPGVKDLCISRTTFDWGIKFPNNDKHVVYVWIDALVNYISALGYGSKDDSNFKKYWPCDVHFVGRDITRFHSTHWPVILNILGLKMPKQIHSTGFITLKGDKISKSKSNGFNPLSLINRYGVDALRYYLLKEGPIYNDTPYSSEMFVNTVNNDLCNTYGNLVNRTVAMTIQYFDGAIPKPSVIKEDEDSVLIEKATTLFARVNEKMQEQRVDLALDIILDIMYSANKYVDITMPWKLKKEENISRLSTVIYTLCETIRISSVLLKAFLVELPNIVFEEFKYNNSQLRFDSIKEFSLKNYNVKVVKTKTLFNRLDVAKEMEFLDATKENNSAPINSEKAVLPKEQPDKNDLLNVYKDCIDLNNDKNNINNNKNNNKDNTNNNLLNVHKDGIDLNNDKNNININKNNINNSLLNVHKDGIDLNNDKNNININKNNINNSLLNVHKDCDHINNNKDISNPSNLITIDDFDKINLVVGVIKHSEIVEKTDKLLKNTITIDGVDRIIVSGIAKYYKPEELIGKRVIVVENLKPIKLKGIESFGMLLCAENKDGGLSLLSTDKNVEDGSKVC